MRFQERIVISLALVCFYDYTKKKCNSSDKVKECRSVFVIQNRNKEKNWNKQRKQHKYSEIGMQANWDEKYLTQVGYFSHINLEWKVSRSGDKSHIGEMSHLK